jgi:hypothetical protein
LEVNKFSIWTIRDFIDKLIEKIPEKIMVHIRRVFYLIGATIILYGIYFGASTGYASAKQEGQELGKDTKTLFQEEVERTYNRKRKSIRTLEYSNVYEDDLHLIQKFKEPFEEKNNLQPSLPSDSLFNKDEEFKPKQTQSNLPPLEEISKGTTTYFTKQDSFDSGYMRANEDKYYTQTLKETPNNNYKILEKKKYKVDTNSLLKNTKKEKLLPMDN